MDGTRERAWGGGRVFLRGTRYWIAYYRDGQEFRESARTRDPVVADRRLAARLRQSGRDDFLGPKLERVKVEAVLEDYLTHLELKGAKAMKAARAKHARLLEAFAELRVSEVTTPVIEDWMKRALEAGAARATVSTQAAHLKSALRHAMRNGKMVRVPYIPGLRLNNARRGFFERDQVERLLPALPAYVVDVARFAYHTGWRKEEILGLRWSDVDRAGGVITIGDTKNGEGRPVPIVGPLVELIEQRWRARAVDGRLSVYVFHRDGQRIGSFNTAWDSACRRVDLAGRLFHDFRRTAVRDMVRAGVPETVAMTISGHRSRAVFQRYNITSVADMREALQRTEAHRAGQLPTRTEHGQSGQVRAIGAGNRPNS